MPECGLYWTGPDHKPAQIEAYTLLPSRLNISLDQPIIGSLLLKKSIAARTPWFGTDRPGHEALDVIGLLKQDHLLARAQRQVDGIQIPVGGCLCPH